VIEALDALLNECRAPMYLLLRHLRELERPCLLQSDVARELDRFAGSTDGVPLRGTAAEQILSRVQEVVVLGPILFLAIREDVARWRYVQLHGEEMLAAEIDVSEFLAAKERTVLGAAGDEDWVLELDLRPFERGFPRLTKPRSIGRGVEHLNRHLSARLLSDGEEGKARLFRFLSLHGHEGRQLMVNGSFGGVDELEAGLREAIGVLGRLPPDREGLPREVRRLGFEPGWGRTAGQIQEGMELLSELLEAPSSEHLERFLDRIPMIFSIAILSPHGYLAQSDVLGMPDTGGQVVYILDQVRALEREMRDSIREQGLDVEPQIVVLTRLIPEAEGTTCDERLEPIIGTRNARILRVPFRDAAGRILPRWISRFDLWPYLERYARDAERELLAELGGRPDFIIGNYSDGNLVASLMAGSMGVTQCNVAHALEKTKYLQSDLLWREHEEEYHFSCQYTADLISMNTADFIITSTYQEIAGTPKAWDSTRATRRSRCRGCTVSLGAWTASIPSSTWSHRGRTQGSSFPSTKASGVRTSSGKRSRHSCSEERTRSPAVGSRIGSGPSSSRCPDSIGSRT
jgi:sucrose synthase